MKKLKGTVCFKIAGDWLTDHCRNLVLEDNHIHAIRTLQTLDGIPMDEIFNILKGNRCLTGVNTLTLKDDDATKYKADLQYRYAGLIKYKGKICQPYALVTNYGEDDMMWCYKQTDSNKAADNYFTRARFYADDQFKDESIKVNVDNHMEWNSYRDVMALFHEVNNVPDFIAIDVSNMNDFQQSFDEYIKLRKHIDIRGWVEAGYEAENQRLDWDYKARMETETDKDDKEWQKIKEKEQTKKFKEKGLDEYGRDEWGLDPTDRHLADWRDDKFEKSRHGWLLPDGEFYSCHTMEHRCLADVICKMKYGIKDAWNPEREIEQRYCLKFGTSFTGDYVGYDSDCIGKYTQAQMDIVYEWCKKNKVHFPKHVWEIEEESDK